MTNYEKYFGTPERLVNNPFFLTKFCIRTNDPDRYVFNCVECKYYSYASCLIRKDKNVALKWLQEEAE